MAHRSFQKGRNDDESQAPEEVTFDVGECTDLHGRPRVNGKLLMDLVAKVDSPSIGLQAEGITDVFDLALMTSDGDNPDGFSGKPYKKHTPTQLTDARAANLEAGVDPTSSLGRLSLYLDDPNTYIEIEELAEIVGWLVEQYTSRPPTSADNSPNGTGGTQGTSKAGRRLPEGSSARSRRAGSTRSSTESSASS